jgi:hypothetical protein
VSRPPDEPSRAEVPSSGTAHQPTAATAPGHSFLDTYKAYLDHFERRVESH